MTVFGVKLTISFLRILCALRMALPDIALLLLIGKAISMHLYPSALT
jgi:hypothetical protein